MIEPEDSALHLCFLDEDDLSKSKCKIRMLLTVRNELLAIMKGVYLKYNDLAEDGSFNQKDLPSSPRCISCNYCLYR